MDDELTWFRAMPADRRSWVTLVAQAGIPSLVARCRNPDRPPALPRDAFGAAAGAAARGGLRCGAPGAGPGGRPQTDRRPHPADRRRAGGPRRVARRAR